MPDIVIQQMEKTEGGISQIERQALLEIAESPGARNMHVVGHSKKLTNQNARAELNKKKTT